MTETTFETIADRRSTFSSDSHLRRRLVKQYTFKKLSYNRYYQSIWTLVTNACVMCMETYKMMSLACFHSGTLKARFRVTPFP